MKKIKPFNWIVLSLAISLLIACNPNTKNSEQTSKTEITDPLPSWNKGTTKSAIINYVKDVTNKKSTNFIAIPDRVVTFDNDGNLWSEQPAYFQLFFAMDRVKALADKHPEWKTTQPFKAVLENDMKELAKHGEHGLIEIVMATHAGNTIDEFEAIVKE